MNENILKEIQKLHGEIEIKKKEVNNLLNLIEIYPDIRKETGRWNKTVFCSKLTNNIVTKFDMRHNCGCCNDSPLEIWPYLETPHGNVYSDPPKFVVGEMHWISGDRPYENWNKKMRDHNIPEAIIDAIQVHFDNCKARRKELLENE